MCYENKEINVTASVKSELIVRKKNKYLFCSYFEHLLFTTLLCTANAIGVEHKENKQSERLKDIEKKSYKKKLSNDDQDVIIKKTHKNRNQTSTVATKLK